MEDFCQISENLWLCVYILLTDTKNWTGSLMSFYNCTKAMFCFWRSPIVSIYWSSLGGHSYSPRNLSSPAEWQWGKRRQDHKTRSWNSRSKRENRPFNVLNVMLLGFAGKTSETELEKKDRKRHFIGILVKTYSCLKIPTLFFENSNTLIHTIYFEISVSNGSSKMLYFCSSFPLKLSWEVLILGIIQLNIWKYLKISLYLRRYSFDI